MKTEKKELQEAIKALRDIEAKIANLESRRAELERKQEGAAVELSEAREALDSATEQAAISGDETALQKARAAITEAKQEHDSSAEQIEAIDRVIERSKTEIEPALNAAQRAHRMYWAAVEKVEREKAKAVTEQLLRAYAAHRAAVGIRDSINLETYLNGGPYTSGLLREVGVVQEAAREVSFSDGIEQTEPRSKYGTA